MKYTVTIDINKPLDEVAQLLDDPANLPKWQRGLKSFEHVSGTPGEAGAVSTMVFEFGKNKELAMTETILEVKKPAEMKMRFEAQGVVNNQHIILSKVDESTTRWTAHNEFLFKGFMLKMMGFLMPGAFKKQTRIYLNDFKAFAEHGTDVRDAAN